MKIYPGSEIKYTKIIIYCIKNVIYFAFSTHPLKLLLLHFLLNLIHLPLNTTGSSHHTFYTSSGLPPHHTLYTVK